MSTASTGERPPSSRKAGLVYGAAALLSAAIFALGTRYYLLIDYFADDAFISLRYAERLARGSGLTWNDGEYVEGYSNLLWVLAEAATIALGMDPVMGMRVLSFLGMGLGLLCLGLWLRPGRTGWVLPGAFAMLAWSSTQLHLIATASGFETPFVVGFLSLALLLILPALERDHPKLGPFLLAGIPLSLIALTRPDGALFTATVGLGLLLSSGGWLQRITRAVSVAVVPTLCVAGQLAFRLWRYQDWIPNTARVKLPGGLERAQEGLDYVLQGLHHQRGIWIVALIALAIVVRRRRNEPRLRDPAVLLLTLTAGWTAYVIYAGGVWLPGRRFLVPTVMLSTWLAGLGLWWFLGLQRVQARGWVGKTLLVVLLGSSLLWLRAEQWQDPQINRCIHHHFHWRKKGILLAELWTTAFAARGEPSIAVDTAGAIPYYTGWTTIDMLGLNDRWIATHPPEDPAWKLSGHTHGDGGYVIDRAPDIVFFGVHWGTMGGVFTGGLQMHEDPRFYRDYRYLEMERLEPQSPRIRTWLLLESPVLGVVREEDGIEVPAWFVANETSGRHRIEDALRLPLAPGETATASGIRVPAGRWSASARFAEGASPPSAVSAVLSDGGQPVPVDEEGVLLLENEASLDLELRAEGDAPLLLLEALELTRR